MRFVIALGVLVVVLAGGYYVITAKSGTESAVTESVASRPGAAITPEQQTVKTFAKTLEHEIPSYRLRAAGRSISSVRVAEIEAHFDDVLKNKGDPRIVGRLNSTTPIGQRLDRLAMSIRLADQLSNDEMKQLGAAYLSDFSQSPQETVAEAKAALSSLTGPDFAQERLGVFATLNSLPEAAGDIKDLVYNDLTTDAPPARPTEAEAGTDQTIRNQALSMGPAQVLPVYEYGIYLNSVGSNSGEALNGTLQIIQNQPDQGLRVIVASAFINQYPDMKTQLYDGLAQVQITLPDIQPQAVPSAPETHVAPNVIAGQ